MRYRKVPKRLIEETKRIIKLHQFLRYDCGLKFADKLSVKDLKKLINIFQDISKSPRIRSSVFITDTKLIDK